MTFAGFHPRKPIIITGAEDIRLWDAETYKEIARYPLEVGEYARAITWYKDRLVVAIVSEIATRYSLKSLVRIYDLDHQRELSRFFIPNASPISISFIPNTDELIADFEIAGDVLFMLHAIQIRNWKTGQILFDVSAHEPINSAVALPGGRHVLVSGAHGPTIGYQVWEIVKETD